VIDAVAGGTVEFTGANTYTGGTLVEAGTLLLASGGAGGTGGITIQSGAHVVAGSGGSASDITLDSGGKLSVLTGGTVSGLTIDDPHDRNFAARATVASGGTLEGTTNLLGGELLLHQSAVVPTGMDLILQSTARLLLDETGHGFEGVIRDFGPSDTLDLAHVAFAGGGRNATTVHWDRTGGDRVCGCPGCPFLTRCGHRRRNAALVRRCLVYSITLSARTRNVSGIVSPSAFAVVRLTTKSNLVGCSTGMSAGLVPRRI
jgi:autotransporter-associated beta strand protein/autotransporter passenger strand-loop-strand repeat protein